MGVPRDECEDVAQQAWLEAAKQFERFHGEHGLRRLRCWLVLVAHNRALDVLRDLKRRSILSLDGLAAEPMDRNAEVRVDVAEWCAWLAVVLTRLRREEPENCWLLCQHRLQGQSIQELTEETGWNANEIRCRIYRGMQRMREWASEFRGDGADAS